MEKSKHSSTLRILILSACLLSVAWLPRIAAAKAERRDSERLTAITSYGARLDIWGRQAEAGLALAAGLHLEWLAVDLDWARLWPDPARPLDAQRLDQIMAVAADQDTKVLLSLANAPGWAMEPAGPQPNQTADLIAQLARRYPALQAVELFPAANTARGWGAPPSPQAYLSLFEAVQIALDSEGREVQLVAGGFTPGGGEDATSDIDDLIFLDELYALGAASSITAVGLRLPEVNGPASAAPGEFSSGVLRRYESIRNVMLKHGHHTGTIWITAFAWPADQTAAPHEQASWLDAAYRQLASQLYIEVTFLDSLNSGEGSAASSGASLIDERGGLHPAVEILRQHIRTDYDYTQMSQKNGPILSLRRMAKQGKTAWR